MYYRPQNARVHFDYGAMENYVYYKYAYYTQRYKPYSYVSAYRTIDGLYKYDGYDYTTAYTATVVGTYSYMGSANAWATEVGESHAIPGGQYAGYYFFNGENYDPAVIFYRTYYYGGGGAIYGYHQYTYAYKYYGKYGTYYYYLPSYRYDYMQDGYNTNYSYANYRYIYYK